MGGGVGQDRPSTEQGQPERETLDLLYTGIAEPPEFMPVADSFAGGDGTEDSPYEIADGEQLARLAWCLSPERVSEDLSSEEWLEYYHMEEAYYVLTADIELNDVSDFDSWLQSPPEYNWYPIDGFRGHLDGQGHVIRGLYSCTSLHPVSDYSDNDRYQGLFSRVSDDAALKDITLEKSLLINHKGTVASFAAEASDARIENCRSDAILWLDGEGSAAGLLGSAYRCYVADCTFAGIMGGDNNQHDCSGIAGSFRGYMENCRNEADITTGGSCAGGITGILQSRVTIDPEIKDRHGNPFVSGEETKAFLADKPDGLHNCVNTGNITVTSGDSAAGGIAQRMSLMDAGDVVVSDCRNEGDITCVSGEAGGICGNVDITTLEQENGDRVGSFTLRSCVNTGTVSGLAPASEEDQGSAPGTGGLAGMASLRAGARFALEDCRNEGNVNSVDTAGGLVGMVITIQGGSVSMTGCANEGDVEGSGSFTAGLLAAYTMETDEEFEVRLDMKECVNNGKITAQSAFVGGLCGHILAGETHDRAILVEDCANNGDMLIAPGALAVGYGLATGAPVRTWKFDGFTNTGTCTMDLTEYTAEEYADLLKKKEATATLMGIVGLTYDDATSLENCRQEGQALLRFSDKDVDAAVYD